jgi:hypothetical protein
MYVADEIAKTVFKLSYQLSGLVTATTITPTDIGSHPKGLVIRPRRPADIVDEFDADMFITTYDCDREVDYVSSDGLFCTGMLLLTDYFVLECS